MTRYSHFGACRYFLLNASHGPYYAFYTLYLESYHYSAIQIGILWSIGVLAEIGLFLILQRVFKRFQWNSLLKLTLFLTALRWLIIAWLPAFWFVQLCAQLLHAASFGLAHALAIVWLHRHFSGRLQGRGQALYSSIGCGLGMAAGNYLAGFFWVLAGGRVVFACAAMVNLLAIGIVWFMKPEQTISPRIGQTASLAESLGH